MNIGYGSEVKSTFKTLFLLDVEEEMMFGFGRIDDENVAILLSK